MNHRIVPIVLCIFAVVPVGSARACSFCQFDPGTSLLMQLDSAKAAVFAELIDSKQHAESPQARYRISTVLKGDLGVQVGEVIDLPLDVQAPPGSVHLFFLDRESGKWGNPRGVSIQARSFLSDAAVLPTVGEDSSLDDRARRLAFVLPYLTADDREVARSAYGEFAIAPDAAVKQLKPLLNYHELLAWLQLNSLGPQTRGLVFTLLRVADRRETLLPVKEALNDGLARGSRGDLDSIIATFLTLSGHSGLEEINRRVLTSADVPLEVRRAAARALRFHVDNETAIERDQLIASCRLLLTDPKTADFIISDLARWNDWEALDEIRALRKDHADQCRWLRAPILEYLDAYQQSKANE